jgi:hypothetical protein
LTPSLRVSERNELYKLHGLVCDYDSKISDADLGGLAKNAVPQLLPMWISHTFSGGARLVLKSSGRKVVWVRAPPPAMNSQLDFDLGR